jgi:hypothetical protein
MPASRTGDARDSEGAVRAAGKADQPPKRGEAAWRAQREAIASRNEQATRIARARRQQELEQQLARERAAERRERAELTKHWP